VTPTSGVSSLFGFFKKRRFLTRAAKNNFCEGKLKCRAGAVLCVAALLTTACQINILFDVIVYTSVCRAFPFYFQLCKHPCVRQVRGPEEYFHRYSSHAFGYCRHVFLHSIIVNRELTRSQQYSVFWSSKTIYGAREAIRVKDSSCRLVSTQAVT
jgi:hypothetical protein